RVTVPGMNEENTVDATSDAAWSEFRALLADHLDALPEGHSLVLACPHTAADPFPPCVQFYGWDAATVRCEILSDEFLAPHRRWTEEGRALLRTFGFSEPTPSSSAVANDVAVNWYLDSARSYADKLADAAVRVVRTVWGVPHPSFVELGGDMSGPVVEHRTAETSMVEIDEPDPFDAGPFDTFRPVRTSGDAQRCTLIEHTLQHLLGFVPQPDDDGDYPFRLGPAWLYVCPTPEAPFVQILAPLAAGVTDTARALMAINTVNRRWPHVKVLLDEDRVIATIDVTVVPFVPQHIVDMLAVMEKFMMEASEALVAALGARPYLDALGDPTVPHSDVHDPDFDGEGADAAIPDELCAIAEWVWEGGPDLPVDEVLDRCGHDRTRIAAFLDISRECELTALGRTLDDADPRRAASAGLDARVWRATSALLTSAHRRLAADRAGESSGAQLDLFGTDLAGGAGDSLFD
ncbi:MAG: hypothetical protein WBF79_07210, partial [Rhodococcus sp. (in: high G+C Gram-positive bacteria)]